MKIVVAGEIIEQVKELCYSGSMTSGDARCHREIKRTAFYRRKELLRGQLTRCLKKRMVKTLIWSVTLYCAETWTPIKKDITRSKAFEMWIWCRMEKISWTEHISNQEVLKLVEEKFPVNDNKNETTELDERGLASKRNNRRKNGG